MRNHLFLFLLFAVAVSCETTSEIDIGVASNKLDLRGELHADSVIKVSLLSTRITTDNLVDPFRLKNEAEVRLYKDDHFAEKLTLLAPTYEGDFESFYLSPSGLKPEPGHDYRIEVSVPNFEAISANTKASTQIDITNVEFLIQKTPITDGYYGHPFTVWFEDDPDVEDYFILETYVESVYEETWNNGDSTVEVNREINNYKIEVAPRIHYSKGLGDDNPFQFELYFSDAQLDGDKIKKFQFFVRTYDGLDPFLGEDTYSESSAYSSSLFVRLKHVSEAHFEYKRTSLAQSNKLEDPFAEPVLIRSNVNGGFGIFSIYTASDSDKITE